MYTRAHKTSHISLFTSMYIVLYTDMCMYPYTYLLCLHLPYTTLHKRV